MIEDNKRLPARAPVRGQFMPRGAPSAALRLIRDGLITPEAYDRLFSAETTAWMEIMSMDEAALDTELGKDEAAAINASVGGPAEGWRGPPDLRVIETEEAANAPAREHYRLRLAGVDGGLMAPPGEVEAEVRKIRRLLMASEGGFLPDVFHDLNRYVHEGRLLIVERLEHGTARIVGCVVYEPVVLMCTAGLAGSRVHQRINMIRLLAVHPRARRAHLAIRLCLEAQLRGTVRVLHEEGPQCIGTVGIILAANQRALAWATRLNHRVRLLGARAKAAAGDPGLAALRDRLEASRDSAVRGIPYQFVVANRTQLFEAAHHHLLGITPYAARHDGSGMRVDYDREDPCSTQVRKVAIGIVTRDPETLRRLGLTGDCGATLWGPPPTAAMSIPIDVGRESNASARTGAAA